MTTIEPENCSVPYQCEALQWRIANAERTLSSMLEQGSGLAHRERLERLEKEGVELRSTLNRVIALLLGNLVGIITLLATKIFQHHAS